MYLNKSVAHAAFLFSLNLLINYTVAAQTVVTDTLVNKSNSTIYQAAGRFQFGYMEVKKLGKIIHIDMQGNELFDDFANQDDRYSKTKIIVVKKNELYGAIDKEGQIIIPIVYEQVEKLSNKSFLKTMKNGLLGIIDSKNNVLLNFEFDSFDYLNDSLLVVEKAGNKGIFSFTRKKIILAPIYDDANYIFSNTSPGLIRVEKDGKYGVADMEGNEIISPLYDDVYCSNNMCVMELGTKKTVLSLDKKINIPANADFFSISNDYYKIISKEKIGLVNFSSGKQILAPIYTAIEAAEAEQQISEAEPIKSSEESEEGDYNKSENNPISTKKNISYFKIKNIGYGIADSTGKIIVPTAYTAIGNIMHGHAPLQINGKWGVMNVKGKMVVPTKYSKCSWIDYTGKAGIILLELNGLKGWIDVMTGKIYEPKFKEIFSLFNTDDSYKLIQVSKGEKKAVIEISTGKLIVPFDNWTNLENKYNLLLVEKSSGIGIYTKQGEMLLEPENINIQEFKVCSNYSNKVYTDTLLLVSKEWLNKGLYSKQGKQILPIVYNEILAPGNEKLLLVKKFYDKNSSEVYEKDSLQLANKDGSIITTISSGYDASKISNRYYFAFNEGMMIAEQNKQFGFIDSTGKTIVTTQYDDVENFKDGFAFVKSGDNWGMINKTGKLIIACKYQYLSTLKNGIIQFKQQDKYGLINNDGKILLAADYDKINLPNDESVNLFIVTKNEKMGLINSAGNIIAPIEYDEINIEHEIVFINKGGKRGIMYTSGKWLLEPIYGEINYLQSNSATALGLIEAKKEDQWYFFTTQGNKLPFSAKSNNVY